MCTAMREGASAQPAGVVARHAQRAPRFTETLTSEMRPIFARLARRHPLDDSPLRALLLLDLEARGSQVLQRLAGQVVGCEADAQRLNRPLHRPHCPHRAAVVGNRAEREGEEDAVEAGVGEVEGLGVAEAKVCLAAEFLRSQFGDLQHLRTQLDPGERDIVGVVGQVAAGPDSDLENLALDPRAGPIPSALEQHSVEESHLAVIARRLLVLEGADALGLATGVLGHRLSHVPAKDVTALSATIAGGALDPRPVSADVGAAEPELREVAVGGSVHRLRGSLDVGELREAGLEEAEIVRVLRRSGETLLLS
jgi:hypothetical protein